MSPTNTMGSAGDMTLGVFQNINRIQVYMTILKLHLHEKELCRAIDSSPSTSV